MKNKNYESPTNKLLTTPITKNKRIIYKLALKKNISFTNEDEDLNLTLNEDSINFGANISFLNEDIITENNINCTTNNKSTFNSNNLNHNIITEENIPVNNIVQDITNIITKPIKSNKRRKEEHRMKEDGKDLF
ncbi:hypothetical protein CDIK_1801 [Cucumispora dikerogammari]|nr:hypothetical protein CDIK_1801 [Cucumispora dikerogammari]